MRETVPDTIIAGQPAWKAQVEKTAAVALATPDDMDGANAYMFSAPTRFGVSASELRAFIRKRSISRPDAWCSSRRKLRHSGATASESAS